MDKMAAAETQWPAPVILGQMFLPEVFESASAAAARRHRLEIRRLKSSRPTSVIKRHKQLLGQIGRHMEEFPGVSAVPVEVGGRAACADGCSPANSQLVRVCLVNNFASIVDGSGEVLGLRNCGESVVADNVKDSHGETKLESLFPEQGDKGDKASLLQGEGSMEKGGIMSGSAKGCVADRIEGCVASAGLSRVQGGWDFEGKRLQEATRSSTCSAGTPSTFNNGSTSTVCQGLYMQNTVRDTCDSGNQDTSKVLQQSADGESTTSVETGLATGQMKQCMLSDTIRGHAGLMAERGKEASLESPPSTSTDELGYPSPRMVEVKDECPPHGCLAICGRRRDMEDAIAAIPLFATVACGDVGGCRSFGLSCGTKDEKCHLHFFGVFDGHGGSQASKYCADRLHQALAAEMRNGLGGSKGGNQGCDSPSGNISEEVQSVSHDWWRRALSNSFMLLDYHVTGQCNGGPCCKQPGSNCSPPGIGEGGMNTSPCLVETIAPESTGSTAVVAVVGKANLVVANVGDSRAVLSRGGRTIALSKDHKPEREDEMARVEQAGGRVIFWNGWRVLGVLAMSRAIGDRYLKPYVIAEPEVTFTLRSDDDEFLILASDGLWDVMENEKACDIVRRCMKVQRKKNKDGGYVEVEDPAKYAAATLIKLAYKKGSQDNISVVVVDLRKR
eukprot:TRINITY_DN16472_c0_g1_i1.p1 TRINITY_DN16472_c0_g1~~TRINITY_DN16472_c0_g1_i1.p1  ORF type:complete len:673 (+),score=138.41 TRINITY_DN16472_c0_g1_i1:461-2479(+)